MSGLEPRLGVDDRGDQVRVDAVAQRRRLICSSMRERVVATLEPRGPAGAQEARDRRARQRPPGSAQRCHAKRPATRHPAPPTSSQNRSSWASNSSSDPSFTIIVVGECRALASSPPGTPSARARPPPVMPAATRSLDRRRLRRRDREHDVGGLAEHRRLDEQRHLEHDHRGRVGQQPQVDQAGHDLAVAAAGCTTAFSRSAASGDANATAGETLAVDAPVSRRVPRLRTRRRRGCRTSVPGSEQTARDLVEIEHDRTARSKVLRRDATCPPRSHP